ncbi:hypothetical protein [Pricia sp.]|uniref:hypothetical protein n=1 Tax=Pricia sp. TaxID=2268138 RepID=UPI003594888E
MPLYYDSFKNNPPEGFNGDLNIEGLEIFKKGLEKHFFSEVTVRNCSSSKTSVQLAIELDCNLSLVEMLFHLNKGTWGNFRQGKSSFAELLRQLVTENDVHVDAEEVTLFFKDTTIVINKIYENSISEQLENIFKHVGKHYVHLSKGLTETPYEIYIPVFEESTHANDTLLQNIEAGNHRKNDYFKYWGLYCDSEEDAVIYDLKNSKIEYGDLFMLNH